MARRNGLKRFELTQQVSLRSDWIERLDASKMFEFDDCIIQDTHSDAIATEIELSMSSSYDQRQPLQCDHLCHALHCRCRATPGSMPMHVDEIARTLQVPGLSN